MLVVGPFLLWSQFRSADNETWQDAVTGTVAALVGMVPEGLVLLTSLAFMIATVTLARRQTLVQELPAVEGLARVDVVCLDKTGTLTHGDIVFDDVRAARRRRSPTTSGRLLALSARRAGRERDRGRARRRVRRPDVAHGPDGIPFSSARKWSAVRRGRTRHVGARRARDGAPAAARLGP